MTHFQDFDHKKNILALDFDGVIVDSILECLVSGYNAFADYSGKQKAKSFNDLDTSWVKQARFIRNFIRNGEDYVYIALAIDKKLEIKNQTEFDDFKNLHEHLCTLFFDLMYAERISSLKEKPEMWKNLNVLYSGMKEFLFNYPSKINLYVVTTKKLIFVKTILKLNNIDLHDPNLKDTSSQTTKKQIIEEIIKNRECNSEMLFFIDDQIDTLVKIKPTGVQCALAKWGYNNLSQLERAKKENIQALDLRQFFSGFKYN